jgi:transcription antitermination factor NusG
VVEDEPRFLRQLADVRTIVSSGLELAVQPLLTKGRRVRVVGGPLHGIEGYIDTPDNPRGIVVSIDVLRQGLLVTMPLENLQPLP